MRKRFTDEHITGLYAKPAFTRSSNGAELAIATVTRCCKMS